MEVILKTATDVCADITKTLDRVFEGSVDSPTDPVVVGDFKTDGWEQWTFPNSRWFMGPGMVSVEGRRNSVDNVLHWLGEDLSAALRASAVRWYRTREPEWKWWETLQHHLPDKMVYYSDWDTMDSAKARRLVGTCRLDDLQRDLDLCRNARWTCNGFPWSKKAERLDALRWELLDGTGCDTVAELLASCDADSLNLAKAAEAMRICHAIATGREVTGL
jgi:hypothetical protein